MAQDLEARVKALEGAVQNLSDQECASHAGALRSEAIGRPRMGDAVVRRGKAGARLPLSKEQ